jgi:ribosomal protein S1
MIKAGDVLEGIVLEIKEKTAVIKFGHRPIEVKVLSKAVDNLIRGETVKVKVKGWYEGKLLLRVLDKGSSPGTIDVRV